MEARLAGVGREFQAPPAERHDFSLEPARLFFFFFITLEPRAE